MRLVLNKHEIKINILNISIYETIFQLIFRIILENNSDGEQGRKLDNGTWTGYIGLIHEGVS